MAVRQQLLGLVAACWLASGEPQMLEAADDSPEIRDMNMVAAVMLLGAMTFNMSLFYMLNHPDKDMKKTSWEVISTTISIFVAVLVFHSIMAVIDKALELVEEEQRVRLELAVDLFTYLVCFSIMHCLIALQAFRGSRMDERLFGGLTPRAASYAREINEEAEDDQEARMKCWATLLAHVTAFAAIHLGSRMQHMDAFKGHFLLCLLPVFMVAASQFVLFRVSEHVPSQHEYRAWLHAVISVRNDVAWGSQLGTDVWDREGEEAEVDVMKLSLSFLLVSALRYGITGVLPNAEGVEHEAITHSLRSTLTLLCVALLFAAVTMALCFDIAIREQRHLEALDRQLSIEANVEKAPEGHKLSVHDVQHKATAGLDTASLYVWRWYKSVFQMCAVAFAWSLLFFAKWQQARLGPLGGLAFRPDSTVSCVACALAVFLSAFLLIYVMDKIADKASKRNAGFMVLAIRSLINSLAVLVGFSWENAFGSGLEIICEMTEPLGDWYPPIVMAIMAVVISVIVVPAWQFYILKKVLRLNKADAEPDESEDEKEDEEDSSSYSLTPMPR